MSFSQTKAKSSATNAAAAVAGGIITHKALQVLAEKAPKELQKYVGLIVAGGAILAPAMLNIKSDAVASALQGGAMIGAISGLNAITQEVDAEGKPIASTGWRASVAKFIPQLSGVEDYQVYPAYYESPVMGLIEAGSQYSAPVAQTQNAVQSLFS